MSCIALTKTGQLCTQPATNTSWCKPHATKLAKYYHNYKTAEQKMPWLDDDTLKQCDDQQWLDDNIYLLMKVYCYRTILRQSFYSLYNDPGHDKRIAIIEGKLKELQGYRARLQAAISQPATSSSDGQTDERRIAQPTSTKQLRPVKEIEPVKGAKLVTVEQEAEKILSQQIFIDLSLEIATKIMDIITNYFTNKFGKYYGMTMRDVAFTCAFILNNTVYTGHILAEPGIRKYSYDYLSKVVPPMEMAAYSCSIKGWKKQYQRYIDCGDIPSILYVAAIVIKSFRIDYEASLPIDSYVRHYHISLSNDWSIATLEKSLPFFDDKNELKTVLGHLDTLYGAANKILPQLDIAFCMKVVYEIPIVKWYCVHLKDWQFRFCSTTVSSAIINLSNAKLAHEMCYFIAFDLERYHNFFRDRYPDASNDLIKSTFENLFRRHRMLRARVFIASSVNRSVDQ